MKLIDLIENLDNLDEDLIIFQEKIDDFNSDIILEFGEESDLGVKIANGKKYHYLIEIFLAKEFIEDWSKSLDYIPSKSQIAERLHKYANNDA